MLSIFKSKTVFFTNEILSIWKSKTVFFTNERTLKYFHGLVWTLYDKNSKTYSLTNECIFFLNLFDRKPPRITFKINLWIYRKELNNWYYFLCHHGKQNFCRFLICVSNPLFLSCYIITWIYWYLFILHNLLNILIYLYII